MSIDFEHIAPVQEGLAFAGRTVSGDGIYRMQTPDDKDGNHYMMCDGDGQCHVLSTDEMKSILKDWWVAIFVECVVEGIERYRRLTNVRYAYRSRRTLGLKIWDDEFETWLSPNGELTFALEDGNDFDGQCKAYMSYFMDDFALASCDVEFAVKFEQEASMMERLGWIKRQKKEKRQ